MSFKILLSSNNAHKLMEVRQILANEDIEVLTPKDLGLDVIDVVEDGETYIENAIKKASAMAKITNLAVMSDDSGIEIKGLNGMPGIRSARFAQEHGGYPETFKYVLNELKGKSRDARFVCHIALANVEDGKILQFFGECKGQIGYAPQGDSGFGYDPLFIPNGSEKSFAVLTQDEKNAISHRKNALDQLTSYLKVKGYIK